MLLALILAATIAKEHPCAAHGGAIRGVSDYLAHTFTLVCKDGAAFQKPMKRGARYRKLDPGAVVFTSKP
jgi:hypothetical protein